MTLFIGRNGLNSCTKVVVTLKRRVGNQLLNTYLPTGCLLLIIYLTHYFKLDHYDTRIMVGLTGKENKFKIRMFNSCYSSKKECW